VTVVSARCGGALVVSLPGRQHKQIFGGGSLGLCCKRFWQALVNGDDVAASASLRSATKRIVDTAYAISRVITFPVRLVVPLRCWTRLLNCHVRVGVAVPVDGRIGDPCSIFAGGCTQRCSEQVAAHLLLSASSSAVPRPTPVMCSPHWSCPRHWAQPRRQLSAPPGMRPRVVVLRRMMAEGLGGDSLWACLRLRSAYLRINGLRE